MKLFSRILILSLLLLAQSVRAGSTFTSSVIPESGITVQVESWLEASPPQGLIPLKVNVQNGSNRTHTWQIQTRSSYGNGVVTSASLTVEGGRRGELLLYANVPQVQTDNIYYYNDMAIDVIGYGIQNITLGSLGISGGGGRKTEFIGMGKKLSVKGWSALRAELEKEDAKTSSPKWSLNGSELDMAQAPDDWRGYTGLSQLWMDESEWVSMSESSKSALLDWVTFGGHVYILGTDVSDAKLTEWKLPAAVNNKRPYGAGEIFPIAWDGKTFPLERVSKAITVASDSGILQQLDDYKHQHPARQLLGRLTLNGTLIFGFIVVFALLVGPINLFVFAGKGRRHRLFWTTPLISIVASLGLILLMVLQDGVGGKGTRLVLAMIMPEQKKMVVLQEQSSKTGVLVSSQFSKLEPSLIQQLNTSDPVLRRGMNEGGQFQDEPQLRAGDWFSSRSIQSQVLKTVRPTRGVIEFIPAQGDVSPAVHSSIEVAMEKVYLIDENNKVWTVDDLGTGEKKNLKAATLNEFDGWMKNTGAMAGPIMVKTLNQVRGRSGYVYAGAKDASKFAIATLDSIRWAQEQVIFVGPYLKR